MLRLIQLKENLLKPVAFLVPNAQSIRVHTRHRLSLTQTTTRVQTSSLLPTRQMKDPSAPCLILNTSAPACCLASCMYVCVHKVRGGKRKQPSKTLKHSPALNPPNSASLLWIVLCANVNDRGQTYSSSVTAAGPRTLVPQSPHSQYACPTELGL